MSERKHTPGPWWVSGTKSVRGPNGEYIARANWSNGENNASLIAAAPELLEALQSVQMALLGYMHQNDITLAALEKARAAIAKAKGEA